MYVCVCVCVYVSISVCVCDEFYKTARSGESHRREEGTERKEKEECMEGRMDGRVLRGWVCVGRGVQSGIWVWISVLEGASASRSISDAASEADRVAAQGCTGTQREHDLDVKTRLPLDPSPGGEGGGAQRRRGRRRWEEEEQDLGGG